MREISPTTMLVIRGAAEVRDALRIAYRDAAEQTKPSEYVAGIAHNTLERGDAPTNRCVESFLTLLVQTALGGNPEGARETLRRAMLVIDWADPAVPLSPPDWRESHREEEHEEGPVEEAETALAHEPTRANAEKYLAKSAKHQARRRRMDDAVRRKFIAPAIASA